MRFIFFILLILNSILYASVILEYDFDGNTNDLSGNNYHGVVDGAYLTQNRFGNENSAYYFDGNDAITATFNLPSVATFAIWARPDNVSNRMLFNAGPLHQGPAFC